MAKRIIYVEQQILDKIAYKGATHHHTDSVYYLPLTPEAIELVVSPRKVPREHLIRDFKYTLDDLETSIRHLRYMQEEL
jgi:hypothetical protein